MTSFSPGDLVEFSNSPYGRWGWKIGIVIKRCTERPDDHGFYIVLTHMGELKVFGVFMEKMDVNSPAAGR